MSTTIVITGVTGFVGGSLAKYLSGLGYDLIGISRSEPKPEIKSLLSQWHQADLSVSCPAVHCDVVVHCAGLASEIQDKILHLNNNTEATINTFNAIVCRQFIYISSASVYEHIKGPLNEEVELGHNCKSGYAISKVKAEQFLNNKQNKNILILRPRAIYGKGDSVLLPKLLKLSLTKKIQLVLGNAHFETSLTHISTLVSIIGLAIEHKKEGIFNVCDNRTYILRDILEDIHFYKHQRKPFQIHFNLRLLNFWIFLAEILRIKSKLNRQSLSYLTIPCILKTDKMRSEFPSIPDLTFSPHEL